jgi:predicted RNase H-like HicB family nuclease
MANMTTGYIDLDMVVRREYHQYSSWCPDLDIASCGDTPEEAVKNLGDAVELYLDTLDEEGELEAALEENGIKVRPVDDPAIPRSFVTQYSQKVKLPAG